MGSPSAPARVYPRRCGGTHCASAWGNGLRGLSPQVRGNPARAGGRRLHTGSIPAGAGEPTATARSGCRATVYPRRCGGTVPGLAVTPVAVGLSPQVRGNRGRRGAARGQRRSIPAGAGEPRSGTTAAQDSEVYPRRCGGTQGPGVWIQCTTGLSPQVRGNRHGGRQPEHRVGSIPAGAGEPTYVDGPPDVDEVYPRRCGGTDSRCGRLWHPQGLSPQVRGNRQHEGPARRAVGSIPAGAGEPSPRSGPRASPRVYPRRCGGTVCRPRRRSPPRGLSPQVRGNPGPELRHVGRDGSIPAGAGEPSSSGSWWRRSGVYPRRCGGTAPDEGGSHADRGLSPQVRGNRVQAPPAVPADGSIPAGAGEPRGRSWRCGTRRVYPRRCGGTGPAWADAMSYTGLSPQVRGNHRALDARTQAGGSIPAGAGEPSPRSRPPPGSRVYPRRCGGTSGAMKMTGSISGLSPQVRGNQGRPAARRVMRGSIPAGAGEPACSGEDRGKRGVYPRRCGGTPGQGDDPGEVPGLSPQVRGNPCESHRDSADAGSIPAGAGEPRGP